MSDDSSGLGESDWSRIRQVVHDEALRARVAASFLPLFGPLPADTQAVPRNSLDYPALTPSPASGPGLRMAVDDYNTMRLATLSVNVYLKNAQLADPELTSAILMFRRAADIMARVEDAILFNGQAAAGEGPPNPDECLNGVQNVFGISGGDSYAGLIDYGREQQIDLPDPDNGPDVFRSVVSAIQRLENMGHLGPFACVMGTRLFTAVTTPMPNSMVQPRDSILPFLDGPLLRSSSVPEDTAVLISLQGGPVEIVVPSDISVRYLQTTMEGQHIFRVKQKFVLRVKESSAISTIAPGAA